MSFELKEKNHYKNPLEQLHERKRELRRLCRQEERMLKEGWEYARHNSGNLLLSGVVGWFLSKQRSAAEKACCSGGGFWSEIRSILRPFLRC